MMISPDTCLATWEGIIVLERSLENLTISACFLHHPLTCVVHTCFAMGSTRNTMKNMFLLQALKTKAFSNSWGADSYPNPEGFSFSCKNFWIWASVKSALTLLIEEMFNFERHVLTDTLNLDGELPGMMLNWSGEEASGSRPSIDCLLHIKLEI